MDTFQKDNQELIANILVQRSTDLIKSVADSRKRDEARDSRRKAAEEARRFEQE